jgi:hypothetical protein
VAITSASFNQVKKIIWHEMKNMYRACDGVIGGELYEDPRSGLVFPDGREIFGFSTKEPERAAGISGANLLYLVDEGSGVEETIFEAIEGNRAGGAKIVMFSNPTKTFGTFYESFHAKRSFWNTIHISSEESPNVLARRKIIPGLATVGWVQEKRKEWGEESPLFKVRVAGDFPPIGEDTVIPLYLVDMAKLDYEEYALEGPLRIGVDIAKFGNDDSVIWGIRGVKALVPKIVSKQDNVVVASKVIEYVEKHKYRKSEDVIVRLD